TRRFELFCEGGGNSWGLDFDEHGNLFYSTNFGGYAMLHGVQGAYYWKQFGKHGALHNPYAFGYFDHVPHQNLPGGHVTVGGIVYQGGSLGEEFHGRYIGADLLGHAAYWHELHPRGSTFSASFAGNLLEAGDTWFAPSDLTAGPDGAIYLCDWHDQRTAHPDPDAQWDATNGRIYRIAKKGSGVVSGAKVDVASLSGEQLVGQLRNKNDWYVRRARVELAKRRDPQVIEPLRKLAMAGDDDHLALEALWTLYVSGGLSEQVADGLLGHGSPDVRWWTVRLLGDENKVGQFPGMRLAEIARYEETAAVRAQLASTAKRLPLFQALPIIEVLLGKDEDVSDPYVPLLLWWAIEKHAVAGRTPLLKLLARPEAWQRTLVRDCVIERLMRRYAAENKKETYQACAQLLAAAPEAQRGRLLTALELGLTDRAGPGGGSAGTLFADQATVGDGKTVENTSHVELPPQLVKEIERSWSDDTTDLAVVRLAVRIGRDEARGRAAAIALDEKLPEAKRIEAINTLGEIGKSEAVEPLLRFLDAPSTTLSSAALAALARLDDARIAPALLKKVPNMDAQARAKACDALLARKVWAGLLLDLVEQNKLPAKEITVEQLRVVALHKDARLDALVKKHWGTIQSGTPEERLAEMRRISNDLRAAAGDVSAGKGLFAKHCGTCHKLFGEGNQVGPELTHANRKNIAELLTTIVDPSAMVRREYQNFLVQTTDGRVLTGLLVEQGAGSLTLLSAKNERTTIAREAIEEIGESTLSLMPENILGPLKPQELRDLFGYLQSEGK
ncbi:MAG: HEAT repeat domain-containing protein, partial [Pirellulales bacterium]